MKGLLKIKKISLFVLLLLLIIIGSKFYYDVYGPGSQKVGLDHSSRHNNDPYMLELMKNEQAK